MMHKNLHLSKGLAQHYNYFPSLTKCACKYSDVLLSNQLHCLLLLKIGLLSYSVRQTNSLPYNVVAISISKSGLFGQKYCDVWFCYPVLTFMKNFWEDFKILWYTVIWPKHIVISNFKLYYSVLYLISLIKIFFSLYMPG